MRITVRGEVGGKHLSLSCVKLIICSIAFRTHDQSDNAIKQASLSATFTCMPVAICFFLSGSDVDVDICELGPTPSIRYFGWSGCTWRDLWTCRNVSVFFCTLQPNQRPAVSEWVGGGGVFDWINDKSVMIAMRICTFCTYYIDTTA